MLYILWLHLLEIFLLESLPGVIANDEQHIQIADQSSIDESIIPIHQQVVFTSTECFLLCQNKLCSITQITRLNESGDMVCSIFDSIEDLPSNLRPNNGSEIFKIDRRPLQDCMDYYERDHTAENGAYKILIEGKVVEVYCEMITPHGKGWTIFQKRFDGSESFIRSWNEYSEGFGDVTGEYWLGLEHIHQFTREQPVELLIYAKRFNGMEAFAKFESFSISDEASGYRLSVSDPSAGNYHASFLNHNGRKFSTFDHDNDLLNSQNCASKYKSGWWFGACLDMNLNGEYPYAGDISYNAYSIHWKQLVGLNEGLVEAKMMFRKQKKQ